MGFSEVADEGLESIRGILLTIGRGDHGRHGGTWKLGRPGGIQRCVRSLTATSFTTKVEDIGLSQPAPRVARTTTCGLERSAFDGRGAAGALIVPPYDKGKGIDFVQGKVDGRRARNGIGEDGRATTGNQSQGNLGHPGHVRLGGRRRRIALQFGRTVLAQGHLGSRVVA